MIQLVLNAPKANIVGIDGFDFTEDKYYGFEWKNGDKGFISRDSYREGFYRMRAIKSLTKGNNWCSFTGSNIRSLMKEVLEHCEKNSNEVRFYCFDSFEELAAFLVDKSSKNI